MATTLSAGDIAITGFNFDNPDELAFVLLVDIEAGTQITFTDNGWLAAGGFRANEGDFTWTAPANLAAGTLITPTVSGVAFSGSGDQILAYQGNDSSPTFLYAVNSEGAGVWQADATNANTSALPAGLVDGATAVALTEIDNAVYTGPTSGTKTELLAAISNTANWLGSNSDRQTLPTDAFTITDAGDNNSDGDNGDGGNGSNDAGLVINEIYASHTGTDNTEFIELFGTPGTSLEGFSFIAVEGDTTDTGAIDARIDFEATHIIGDNGFFLVGNPNGLELTYGVTPNLEISNNFLENSSVTYALVETSSLSGTAVTGAEVVVDSVALTDGGTGDVFFFNAPVVGPDGSFFPAGARRVTDGVDTNTPADFVISDFSLSSANTPTAGTVATQPTVINEVLVSTTGADVEFIEIFGEPGTSLAGLSLLNIEGGTGAGSIDNQFDLPGDAVIGDNGFYLLGNSLVATALGVTPDTEIPTNFFENSSSTIALVETATIAGDSVSGAETVVDAVALQDSNNGTFFYGAPVLGPDGSFYPSAVTRTPDGGDFQLIDAFSPAGANTTPTAGTGNDNGGDNGGGDNGGDEAPLTLISAIQGNGSASPILGNKVTVEAVVVGDFQDGDAGTNGDFNGFFVQEEDTDADGDAATSEGLFIFDGNSPAVDVNVGDRVRVTGTVTEFFGETQLSGVTVEVIDNSNNSGLVTPATITFPVANTITNSDGALIADLEAYEGMLVTIPQELTVSDLFTLGRFGDIGLHADGRLETYTQANMPSVDGFQAYQDLGVRNTVILDDGSTVQNPAVIPFEIPSVPGDISGQLDANDDLNVGDTVTDLTGVVRFSRGSGGSGDEIYRINSVETVEFVNTNPRPTEAPEVGGSLKVASFNVLNFFTSLGDEGLTAGPNGLDPRGADNQAEFDRQVAKLVAALAEIEADVFGLVELENEFGDVNGDGEFAIGFLADALNAAIPGANYQYVDPGMDYVGTDAIAVGFIYNANTVGIAEGTTVEVLSDSDLADLGVDPGNPVFEGAGTSRTPIAVTFEELATGETFTAVNNHFKSKGSISPFGDNAGTGDGTGNNNEARLQAAIAIDAWLDTDPTGSGDDDFLLLGDLNAYAMEDPIQYLLDEGYADMVAAFLPAGESIYSFGFPLDLDTSPQVQAFGALDYALANAALAAQVVGAAEWHINADEASAFDYNTNFKPDAQIDDLFGDNPFRSSDHDPLIIGLNLSSNDDSDTDTGNGGTGGDDSGDDDTDNDNGSMGGDGSDGDGDTDTGNGGTGGDGSDGDDTDTGTDNGDTGTDNGGTDSGGENVVAEILDLTGIDGNITANVSLMREAAFDNLLQFYVTDAQGAVDGINPGEAGYEDAVRQNLLAMPQLFVENRTMKDTTITLEGGFYYAPALVIDGDLHNLATIGDAALGMTMIQRDGDSWFFEDWIDADFNDLEFAINSVDGVA